MARILLGVTGGIAAYKALEFARLAIKAGHSVRVIQTEAATRFVGPDSFAGITGAPVLTSQWESDPARGAFPGDPQPDHVPLSHLELVANADLFLIAPASANTIAKLAQGSADNLLTVSALACEVPLLIAPAMNNAMYENAATQENLDVLRRRGFRILEPEIGSLGSLGEWGVGRLMEPFDILRACEELLDRESAAPGYSDQWRGLRVLVTAGGTREPIDAVRFVGNRSSGRMGMALAEEANRRGAEVTVVAANVSLPRNPAVRYIDVDTASALHKVCVEKFKSTDLLIMSAAVADFRPRPSEGKLKKSSSPEGLTINLEPTEDVLTELAQSKGPNQIVVGFAAEYGSEAVATGRAKLTQKNLDALVVNDISRADIGFDSASNEATVLTLLAEVPLGKAPKNVIASQILDVVETELHRRSKSALHHTGPQ